jgi:hypothetical protein
MWRQADEDLHKTGGCVDRAMKLFGISGAAPDDILGLVVINSLTRKSTDLATFRANFSWK